VRRVIDEKQYLPLKEDIEENGRLTNGPCDAAHDVTSHQILICAHEMGSGRPRTPAGRASGDTCPHLRTLNRIPVRPEAHQTWRIKLRTSFSLPNTKSRDQGSDPVVIYFYHPLGSQRRDQRSGKRLTAMIGFQSILDRPKKKQPGFGAKL